MSCKRQGQKYLLKLPFKRDFYSSLLQEIIEQVFSMLIILSFFFIIPRESIVNEKRKMNNSFRKKISLFDG